jgi:hypothetical protein
MIQKRQLALDNCRSKFSCSLTLNAVDFITKDHEILGQKYNIADYVYNEYAIPAMDCYNRTGTVVDTAIACASTFSPAMGVVTPSQKRSLLDAFYGEDLNKCGGLVKVEWYWQTGHCALIAVDIVPVSKLAKLGKLADLTTAAKATRTTTSGLKLSVNLRSIVGLSDEAIEGVGGLSKLDNFTDTVRGAIGVCGRYGVVDRDKGKEDKEETDNPDNLDTNPDIKNRLAWLSGSLGVSASNLCGQKNPIDLAPIHTVKTRKDLEDIATITKSIIDNGYDSNFPVKVYDYKGITYLVDGHHRRIAAIKAGLKEVPVEYLTKDDLKNLYNLTPEELEYLNAFLP